MPGRQCDRCRGYGGKPDTCRVLTAPGARGEPKPAPGSSARAQEGSRESRGGGQGDGGPRKGRRKEPKREAREAGVASGQGDPSVSKPGHGHTCCSRFGDPLPRCDLRAHQRLRGRRLHRECTACQDKTVWEKDRCTVRARPGSWGWRTTGAGFLKERELSGSLPRLWGLDSNPDLLLTNRLCDLAQVT